MSKSLVGVALAIASFAALAQPAITASGTTLSFAQTPVLTTNSTPTPSTITLTNSGTEKLTITGIEKSGANATEFVATGTCVPVGAPVTVNAGATCTIGATFDRPLNAGSRTATFTVQSNAATNPSITVSGTAAAVTTPSIVLSPTSIVFNTQAVGMASTPRRITVTNNSTVQVSVTQVMSDKDPEFALTTDCVNNPLDPKAPPPADIVCTIDITFTPASAGARTGTVTITSDVKPPRTVSLSGPGVDAASPVGAATLEASTLTFPTTPSGVTATVLKTTLKNTGNKELTLTAVALGGANATEFASSGGTTCVAAMKLGVDESCDLEVNFTPQATGSKSASLDVTHDGVTGKSTVALSGTGTTPPAPPAPPPPSATPTPTPAAPSADSKDGGGGALDGLGLLLLIPALALRARRSRLDP